MAYADYTHCDVCDTKAFYDAEIDWDEVNTGAKAVLCRRCAKTHTIEIKPVSDLLVELESLPLPTLETLEAVDDDQQRGVRLLPITITIGQARNILAAIAKARGQ